MADLIAPITTEMRIIGRILRETALGLKRTGWMNLVIVVTMASILSIFGVVMAMLLQMGMFLKTMGSELEISAFVQEGIDPRIVRDEILKLPHVQKITIVSREKAWSDMQQDYPMPDIDNPLPDTIHVQMKSESYIPATVDQLKEFPQIEEVQYPHQVLNKIRSITQSASLAGTAITVFLGILTLLIISNTIHLLIQAKCREIEILRMMGVGNWYIRLPFLIQGASYGLAGALISYVPLSTAVYYIGQFFMFLGFSGQTLTAGGVLLLLILLGILVGASGSALAIRKYLQV